MHRNDLAHGLCFWKLDVVEEATAQKSVGQFFLVVGRDEHQRPVFRFDELARLVAIKLHAVDLAQQVVRELDIGFINLINQQGNGLLSRKSLPKHALDDVVLNIFDALAAV